MRNLPVIAMIAAFFWISCSGSASADPNVFCRNVPPFDLPWIFFDDDEAAINREAAFALNNVVSAWRELSQCGYSIEIDAYADRSGPAAYNLALSRRRARAVADYLRQRGVSSEIRMIGFGETRPLVDTGDGVREPQNRHAVIVMVPTP